MKTNKLYKLIVPLLFLAGSIGVAWGQSYTEYWKTNYEDYTIIHKTEGLDNGYGPTKWHDLRKGVNTDLDRFEDTDEVPFFTIGGDIKIQPAHQTVDTIYVYPGQTVTLYSPDVSVRQEGRIEIFSSNNKTYQRWYNYKTDGTFVQTNASGNVINDLLRPVGSNGIFYRLQNGYVGNPLTDQFNHNSLYGVRFSYPRIDAENYEDEFIVACDVSIYMDYGDKEFVSVESDQGTTYGAFMPNGQLEGQQNCYEPTIGHRLIYYIRSIQRPDDVTDENDDFLYRRKLYEQNEEITGEKPFVAEYTIHFPTKHVSNNTPEIVGLRMDAQNYKVPVETLDLGYAMQNDEITVYVDANNAARIQLAKRDGDNITEPANEIQLDDRDRFFHIIYPDQEIPDGTSVEIRVTKNMTLGNGHTYNNNLIKYTLIFDEGTELVEMPNLRTFYPNRTEDYLSSRYDLLTELNFDYDPVIGNQYGEDGNQYYHFPMPWEASSYGFHDGGPHRAYSDNATLNKDVLTLYESNTPVWGYYGFAHSQTPKYEGDTYFMQADLSDRPGVIAQLPFRNTLCAGAELFVTALVNSPSGGIVAGDLTNTDVGIRFSIMGRNEGDNQWQTIYSHNSGQITHKDEWQQVYFSFINGSSDIYYNEYCLQLDNVSSGTTGADLQLDKIQVYMARPTATATQKRVSCDERTMVNISLNWEQLYSRLGGDQYQENENAVDGIDFCFIDTLLYREKYAETSDINEAIKYAAVYIGNAEEENGYNEQYGTLYYYWNFDKNEKYTDGKDNLAADNNIAGTGEPALYGFYRRGGEDENEERQITVDIQAELTPLRGYWLLMRDHKPTGDGTENQDESGWPTFDNPDGDCAIRSNFSVTGWNSIKINGEVIGNEDVRTYCAGQVFDFGIQMMYYRTGSNDPIKYDEERYGTVYFDWFFGTQTEYEEPQSDGEPTIAEALEYFREEYPDATNITDAEQATEVFTTEHRNLLLKLLNEQGTGMLNTRLVLHQSRRQIRIQENGLNLVIKPINIESQFENNEELKTAIFCWNPIFLNLDTEGDSPKLDVGFNDVTYPSEWTNDPVFRVGLEQIEKAYVPAENTTNDVTINIPLRNAQPANGDGNVTLKMMANESEHELFLRYSNDPALSAIFADPDFDRHEYSIGKLVSLYAQTRTGNTYEATDVMKLQFNLTEQTGTLMPDGVTTFKFTPREGYYYTFDVHFEEQDNNNDNDTEDDNGGSCFGNLLVTMKVVPEYQKWVGDADANWNNDDNWVRSKKDELKKGNDYTDYTKTHQGYVPMKFTQVTIPTDKQVELYAATAGTGTHPILNLETTEGTGVTGSATTNIEYDLMVKLADDGTNYDCEPYYTNEVDQIHFEPNAEMLHAELLTYEKAWVDYKLESNQWHTLASPLQGVVAGDFYTDSDKGTEEQEYFSNIYFDKKDYEDSNPNGYDNTNSRIKPSVYQRGWKGSGATMVGVGTGDTGERAVAGNWSAVYNNVYDEYKPGEGFSLKVLDMPSVEGKEVENAIFRLPKADNSYSYYTVGDDNQLTPSENSNNGSMPDSRKNAGKLQITPASDATGTTPLHTVTLSGDNQYYLIGNPFMAHLDMKAFLNENDGVGSAYWFNDEDGVQNIISVSENDWITTGSTTAPLVPPLRSFFVRKADNATEPVSVTFTKDMQVLGETEDSNTNTNALILTAKTADGKTSRAAIAYDATAKATYETSEDAELFLDSNLSDVPTIYTVAGTMATSINRTSELYNIPVGIYGNSTEMVTLSFEGLNHFSSATLYDAEKKTETPLHEGTTLTIPASTSGRYFLRAGTPTANEVIETSDIQIYTLSGNRVMVTSNVPLKDIRVYTMNGAQVKHTKAGVCSFELYLPDGIYLITAQNASGETQTEKVVVR